MIRMMFEKKEPGNAICADVESGIEFLLNQMPFENRECRFYEKALLFDGYSIWFAGDGASLTGKKGFTMSVLLAPLGWSDQGDGIFSWFDAGKREGFCLLLEKHGRVRICFGNGRELFSFSSVNAHVRKNQWNAVTVAFWQEAGWCDLYVNGVLSNRKQFPRHMEIKWPQKKAFLGKYVDEERHREEWPAGSFYGLMEEVQVQEGVLRAADVKKLHGIWPVGKAAEMILPDRRVYEKDAQRPAYHLIAPGKWMNEPHGPLYYEGWYHIFYQANPHAPIWNHIQWGHMVSRDMVHWKDMPLALETEGDGPDPDGCWSGSALVDKEGKPRIFYTAGNNGCFPNQFVATAEAEIDGERKLPVWRKDMEAVLRQTEGWLGEFRDPFVWLEGDTYFMLVGTGDMDNGGGNAVLYSSPDLKRWQSHGFFLSYDYEKNREVGHVFELPVLLPLRDESGEVVCHIFLLCGCQIEGDVVENYAFLGKWEPKERRFSCYHEKALLLDLGGGIFTGPSGLVTPDKRSVVFSIAQGRRGGKAEFYAGWAHNGGLPIELSIRNRALGIAPLRELHQLKKRELLCLENVSAEEANDALAQYRGNLFWMYVCADGESLSVEIGEEDAARIVSYERQTGRFGVTDEAGRELGKFRGDIDRVEIGDSPVEMECFLDHSMLEVYLNGKKAITARNYIKGQERRIRLGREAGRIRKLELWEMDSAYGEDA